MMWDVVLVSFAPRLDEGIGPDLARVLGTVRDPLGDALDVAPWDGMPVACVDAVALPDDLPVGTADALVRRAHLIAMAAALRLGDLVAASFHRWGHDEVSRSVAEGVLRSFPVVDIHPLRVSRAANDDFSSDPALAGDALDHEQALFYLALRRAALGGGIMHRDLAPRLARAWRETARALPVPPHEGLAAWVPSIEFLRTIPPAGPEDARRVPGLIRRFACGRGT